MRGIIGDGLTVMDHVVVVRALTDHRRFLRSGAGLPGYVALGMTPPARLVLESLLRAPRLERNARARVAAVLGEVDAFESALRTTAWLEVQRTLLADARAAMRVSPAMGARLRALKALRDFYGFLAREGAGFPGSVEVIGYAVSALEAGAAIIYPPVDDDGGPAAGADGASGTGAAGWEDDQDGVVGDAVAAVAGGVVGGPGGAVIGAILHASLRNVGRTGG